MQNELTSLPSAKELQLMIICDQIRACPWWNPWKLKRLNKKANNYAKKHNIKY